MTKNRMLAAGAAVAVTLVLSGGVVVAQSDPLPAPATTTTMTGGTQRGDMASAHAQMPENMQAQHDAMHAQMSAMDDMDGANMGGTMNSGTRMGR